MYTDHLHTGPSLLLIKGEKKKLLLVISRSSFFSFFLSFCLMQSLFISLSLPSVSYQLYILRENRTTFWGYNFRPSSSVSHRKGLKLQFPCCCLWTRMHLLSSPPHILSLCFKLTDCFLSSLCKSACQFSSNHHDSCSE